VYIVGEVYRGEEVLYYILVFKERTNPSIVFVGFFRYSYKSLSGGFGCRDRKCVYCSEVFLSHQSAPGTLKLIMSDGFSFGNSWSCSRLVLVARMTKVCCR
jgi:hypothetical protein